MALCCASAGASTNAPKRGFGGNEAARFDTVNASWNYNWGLGASPGSTRAEFVPMFWNYVSPTSSAQVAARPEVKTVLGFNEPERPDQANMTTDQAIAMWPLIVATGKRVVSPAVSDGGNGRPWLQDFMAKANAANLKVDAVAFHWYGDIHTNPTQAAANFLGAVDWYHNTFNRPVWITEFGGLYNGATLSDNITFMKAALPGLDSRSYVERYAWWNWSTQTSLVDGATGTFSPSTGLGNFYGGKIGAATGETLDLAGRVGGLDNFYLQGGTFTDTSTGRTSDSISNLDVVTGGSIGGVGKWEITGNDGRIVIRAGTTLNKIGLNTISFNNTAVQSDGMINVQAGQLTIENGTTVGSTRNAAFAVQGGAVLALSSSNTTNQVTLLAGAGLDLHGGVLRSLAYNQSVGSPITLSAAGAEFSTFGQLTVTGSINGTAPLYKTGAGILRLNNPSSGYTGGTNITGGTLWLDSASVTSSSTGTGPVMMAAATTLAGRGRINGATTIAGAVSPGGVATTEAGTLLFASTLTLAATASTTIDLNSDTDRDLLSATGNATIDGTLSLRVAAGYDPAYGTTSSLVSTAALTGRFKSIAGISLTPGKSLAVTYDALGVYVTVALPGDASLDGAVNFADLLTIAQNYSTSGKDWTDGELTGDGTVDFADLLALAQTYGSAQTPASAAFAADFASDWALAQSLVPEPTTLAAVAGIATLTIRRRR